MLNTCKFLFFISFLKIEYNKEPNFAAEFEHMVKNCSNSTRKAGLEISPAEGDWTASLLATKELRGFETRAFTG
jgi:hypothetical protein